MSSGCEEATKMEASTTPLEEPTCMDNSVAPDSSPEPVKFTQVESTPMDEVPVSNIDDVITELTKHENDIKAESQPVPVITLISTTDKSSNLEDKESPSTQTLQPAALDFSVLDSDNKVSLSPVGKAFLNNYCRNYSQLLGENTEHPGKDCEKKTTMYNMLADSDSESDSATDSAVKNNQSPGQCKDLQDTDTEEEIELCCSTSGQIESNQEPCSLVPLKRDISGNQTDEELIADKVPQESSSPFHEMDSKTANPSTGPIMNQTQSYPNSKLDSGLSEDTKKEDSKQTPKTLLTSLPSVMKSHEKTVNTLEALSTENDTIEIQTCKMQSNQLSSSDKQNNFEMPILTELKASVLSTDNYNGKTSKPLTTKDNERIKSNHTLTESLFSSSLKPLENKTLNVTPVSPVLNSRQKQDEHSTTFTKLKGLSIKSQSKGHEGDPSLRKTPSSPKQSNKLTATTITPATSPKMAGLKEKRSASSVKTSDPSQDGIISDLPNTDRSEHISTALEESSPTKEREVRTKCDTTTRQRTFIEVRLSSSSQSSPSPVLACKQTLNTNHLENIQGGQLVSRDVLHEGLEPTPIFGTQVISLKCSVSRADQGTCSNSAANSADRVNRNKLDATITETYSNKSCKSKLYHRALDRRSYSTDGSKLDPSLFSVRQRIKSFENLAGFDRPVLRCIDIHSYGVTYKSPLNRRSSGCTGVVSNHSTDNRSLKRCLSSCVDSLNISPCSSVQPLQSSFSKIINNSDPLSPADTYAPLAEEMPKMEDSVPLSSLVSNAPPVLRSRNNRLNGGISRLKQRELRALSMPELDKLCTQNFSHDPGTVMFKTELEIHPLKPSSDNLQCTVVTRMSMVDPEIPDSNSNGEHTHEETMEHSSWSVSLKDLLSSTLNQKKLQDVLNNIKATLDVMTMVEEINSNSEDKEDVYVVVLTKEMGSGLGFSIAGGVDLEQKTVTVHRVFNQGAAGLDGTIRRGDAVLSINGIGLRGKSHGETLSCLHQTRLAQQAVVIIQRGEDSEPTSFRQEASIKHGLSPAYRDKNGESETAVEVGPDGALSVELRKTSAGLGFTLEGGKASAHGDRPLYIKRIFRGGAAELSQVIDVGDEVLAINGRSLHGLMHYDAWNIIKTVSEGPIRLIIRKPRTSV